MTPSQYAKLCVQRRRRGGKCTVTTSSGPSIATCTRVSGTRLRALMRLALRAGKVVSASSLIDDDSPSPPRSSPDVTAFAHTSAEIGSFGWAVSQPYDGGTRGHRLLPVYPRPAACIVS